MSNEHDHDDAAQRELESQQDAHDCIREFAAREGYMKMRMADLPQVYTTLMPYTVDARELWQAEKAIRRQVAEDLKMLVSPWIPAGPKCKVLDYSNLKGEELMEFGFLDSRVVGMPAAIKPGKGPDGKLWADHPEVLAAIAAIPLTAEHFAHDRWHSLEKDAREASTRYLTALHSGEAKPNELKDLEDAANLIASQATAAREECDRLRGNPIAACQLLDQPGTDHQDNKLSARATTYGDTRANPNRREKLL